METLPCAAATASRRPQTLSLDERRIAALTLSHRRNLGNSISSLPATTGAGATQRSVAGVADQRLAPPEQQHQQQAEHPEHREGRLREQQLDDIAPQPGRGLLDRTRNVCWLVWWTSFQNSPSRVHCSELSATERAPS